jgi:signal-transduction protein with cAMP-binding, CBS, and nucleotidyltransferase domain
MICPHCAFDNLPGSEQCDNCQADLTQLDRPIAQDRVERSLMEDTVSELKPRQAVTLPPTATVQQAIEVMLSHNIGALLIVDDAGQLLGIFSERDLLTKVADPNLDHLARPVQDFMTANPAIVRPTDTLAFVLHQMDCGGYRHLPVLKDGQPLGMISVRDMLRHITRLCKTCTH